MTKFKTLAFAFVSAFAIAGVAFAQQGMFGGYPSASSPLTGVETVPMDTNLSGGRSPQTQKGTINQIRDYTLGAYSNPDTRTATAAAGAVTLNSSRGVITSEALTTAADATYTLTWTNAAVAATSIPLCFVGNGTNSTSAPAINSVTPAAGSVVIIVRNQNASAAALNGTIKVGCVFIAA